MHIHQHLERYVTVANNFMNEFYASFWALKKSQITKMECICKMNTWGPL